MTPTDIGNALAIGLWIIGAVIVVAALYRGRGDARSDERQSGDW